MNEVKGYKELAVTLDKISTQVSDTKFVNDAGIFVRDQAVLLAPKDSGHLQQNIKYESESTDDGIIGRVYTDVEYATFVELGTGKRGAMNHSGISPNVHPTYTMSPWWIHESQIDPSVAERYHWFYIDTPDGRFYQCNGQPANPFMYPALHENEELVMDILDGKMEKIIND